MTTAQLNAVKKIARVGLVTIAISVTLALPISARAAVTALQTCTAGEKCIVEEFLYDDKHTPLTTPDACTFISRDPNGNEYVKKTMDVAENGRYYYQFTTPSVTGVYQTNICCTVGSDYLCIDKNFEIKAAATASPSPVPLASTVWGYSGHTMSSLGNLILNVWQNSSSMLSGFRNLVTDIWNKPTLSKSDTQPTTIGTDAQKTLSLEQLAEKPVIQNFIDEEPVDLNAKIQGSLDIADALYIQYQHIHSQIGLMNLKWNILSASDSAKGLAEIDKILGDENDLVSTESVFGKIAQLGSLWQWSVLDTVYTQTQMLKTSIKVVQLSANEEVSKQKIESIETYSTTLDRLIGDQTHDKGQETVFGKLNNILDLTKAFDRSEKEIDTLLSQENTKIDSNDRSQIDTISRTVFTLNQIPQAKMILQDSKNRRNVSDEDKIKNELLSLKGLIQSNVTLLTKDSKSAQYNTWLEVGSVVFRSLLTNPSSLQSQEVPLKYYLPMELTQEDIMEISNGLSIAYDAQNNQSYVQGSFTLSPEESKVVEVRVTDKWKLSNEPIESLRRQTTELSLLLEKSPVFSQGVTLKGDINMSLDKASTLVQAGVTPDQKIRNFRLANIELTVAKDKLDKLGELVTQIDSKKPVLGFIGSTQMLAVWGLIFIIGVGIASLIFYMRILSIFYMRILSRSPQPVRLLHPFEPDIRGSQRQNGKNNILLHVIAFLTFGLFTASISAITVSLTMDRLYEVKTDANSSTNIDHAMVVGEQKTAAEVPKDNWMKIEVLTIIAPQSLSEVNLRKYPSTNAPIVYKLADHEPVVKLEENGQWIHIGFIDPSDKTIEGWVHRDYTEKYIATNNNLLSHTIPQY